MCKIHCQWILIFIFYLVFSLRVKSEKLIVNSDGMLLSICYGRCHGMHMPIAVLIRGRWATLTLAVYGEEPF